MVPHLETSSFDRHGNLISSISPDNFLVKSLSMFKIEDLRSIKEEYYLFMSSIRSISTCVLVFSLPKSTILSDKASIISEAMRIVCGQ